MFRPVLRASLVGALVATGLAVVGVGAAVQASAAAPKGTGPNGGVITSATPATGSDLSTPTYVTSGGCTSPDATNFAVILNGNGFVNFSPSGSQQGTFSHKDPITVSQGKSFKDAATFDNRVIKAGEYDVTVECLSDFGDISDTYTGTIIFRDATHYAFTPPTTTSPTTTTTSASPTKTTTSPSTTGASPSPTPTTTTGTSSPAGSTGPTGSIGPSTTANPSGSNTASTSTPASTSAPASGSPSPSRTATTAPIPTPNLVAKDAGGNTLPSNPVLTEGEKVYLTITKFHPSEQIGVAMHSTTRLLPATSSDAQGTVKYTVTVPADLEVGQHLVDLVGGGVNPASVTGAVSIADVALFPFRLAPASAAAGGSDSGSLPFTGVQAAALGGVAAVLLIAGTALVLLGRRRGWDWGFTAHED